MPQGKFGNKASCENSLMPLKNSINLAQKPYLTGDTFESAQELRLLDVSPFSLGMKMFGGTLTVGMKCTDYRHQADVDFC